MRHEHRAGEKLFVDYAGDTIAIYNDGLGEVWQASIFVAVLGAAVIPILKRACPRGWVIGSVHTCAPSSSWAACPRSWVPDNLKMRSDEACRYEPSVGMGPTKRWPRTTVSQWCRRDG